MRKTKTKTATGIVVEIRSSEHIATNVEKETFVENNISLNEDVLPEKKEVAVVEKPYISPQNEKVPITKPIPVWTEKPVITEKNTRIYPKKRVEIPAFVEEDNIELPQKEVETSIIAVEKPTVIPAKKELAPEKLAETLVLQKKHIGKKEKLAEEKRAMIAEEKAIIAENKAIIAENKGVTPVKTPKTPKIKPPKKEKEKRVLAENTEIWLPLEEGNAGIYEISNYGRIKSYAIYPTGKIRTGTANKNEGFRVEIFKNGVRKLHPLSRLVAKYFVPNPENTTKLIHKDGNLQNNAAENLEWRTFKHENDAKNGSRNNANSIIKQQRLRFEIEAAEAHKIALELYGEEEIWAEVKEGKQGAYKVSNYGRVMSYHSNKEGKQMRGKPTKNSANIIEICNNKGSKGYGINRLVGMYFLPNPEKKTHVMHLDGNYHNNYYKNLLWVTQNELIARKPMSKKRTRSKITYEYAELIRKMLEDGVPQHKVAKMFCVSSMQVTRIKRRENWVEA